MEATPQGNCRKAQSCSECQKVGKDLQCIELQKEFGKLPEANERIVEFSIAFDGPFQSGYQLCFVRTFFKFNTFLFQ